MSIGVLSAELLKLKQQNSIERTARYFSIMDVCLFAKIVSHKHITDIF